MPYADKTKQKLHRTWQNMVWRCYRKEHTSYKYYGGRGIKVCEEWQKFEPFYHWAISNGYADNLTIDRINVNGDYEPSNCRWATMKAQANNRRSSHFVTYNGTTKTVAEWAEEVGISQQAMLERLSSSHWSIEEAVTTKRNSRAVKQPLFNKKVKQIYSDGTTTVWNSISEAAIALKLHNANISRALKKTNHTAGGCHWEYV